MLSIPKWKSIKKAHTISNDNLAQLLCIDSMPYLLPAFSMLDCFLIFISCAPNTLIMLILTHSITFQYKVLVIYLYFFTLFCTPMIFYFHIRESGFQLFVYFIWCIMYASWLLRTLWTILLLWFQNARLPSQHSLFNGRDCYILDFSLWSQLCI